MSNIKEFAYNDKTQLTKNINVSELIEKTTGHTHKNKIDLDHVNKIQDFMAYIGADRVDFSSGYRCPAHDKEVKGSGSGQHTKGTATDQKFSKNGKAISGEEVCCKAQDFGFKGIGYMKGNYVHLDSRTKGTYRGDERKNFSNNVGGDFYKYFGISKSSDSKDDNFKTFVKGVQSACGAKVDGIPGPETLSKTITLSTKKNNKHKVVKVLQTYLISIGYSCGKCGVDGIYGSATKSAVMNYQKANGCVVDGVIDAKNKTWKKLLKLV